MSDECWLASRHIEEAREHAWVRAHLELRTTVRASKAPAGAPIEWHVAVPEHLRTLFPAVSRDGRTVVARYRESASQEIVDDVERMSFFSVTTGKPIATFVLDMARELDLGTKASPAALREARERDRVAANRLLDATEWRRLPTSRMADDICPGAFEELDRERSRRQDWEWDRVARFEGEGVDLEYDPAQKQIIVRAVAEDGSLSIGTRPADRGFVGPCGEPAVALDVDAFGSRSLGVFFVVPNGDVRYDKERRGCSFRSMADRMRAVYVPGK
ncbi:MAG: hypothetical protein KF850_21760 [Labilithrix sp.]|nr:hypothetical protein [Labilithrix sp.]